MNILDEFHDLRHSFSFPCLVILLLLIIIDLDSAFKVANYFFVGHLTRFICLICTETEPRFLQSTGLASLDIRSHERRFREELGIVLQFVIKEPTIVKICDV